MPELKGDHPQSSVYVEVAIPTENGERVVFYTEEYTTDQLDLQAVQRMLAKSGEAVAENLGLRNHPM
jgi:hypothetical protein